MEKNNIQTRAGREELTDFWHPAWSGSRNRKLLRQTHTLLSPTTVHLSLHHSQLKGLCLEKIGMNKILVTFLHKEVEKTHTNLPKPKCKHLQFIELYFSYTELFFLQILLFGTIYLLGTYLWLFMVYTYFYISFINV